MRKYFSIQVGDDQGGKDLLERMAKASGYGFGVNGDQILSSEGMAGFAHYWARSGRAEMIEILPALTNHMKSL